MMGNMLCVSAAGDAEVLVLILEKVTSIVFALLASHFAARATAG